MVQPGPENLPFDQGRRGVSPSVFGTLYTVPSLRITPTTCFLGSSDGLRVPLGRAAGRGARSDLFVAFITIHLRP